MALIPRGLAARLVLATMVITALVVSGIVVVVQVYLGRVSIADSTRLARDRAEAVAGTVRPRGGTVTVLESGANSLDRDVWVFDSSGRLVEGRMNPVTANAVRALAAGSGSGTTTLGERVRLVARPVTQDGTRVAVVVAGVDLRPYEDGENRGLWLSLVLGLLTVLAAGVAAREAARHTLSQVGHMVRSAHDWEEHDLDRRFAMGAPVDEISELGQTLDHMLDRIAAALHAERRLSDEVAHELRTPLAVIRAEAELALATADPGQQESLRSIVEAAERLDGVVSAMLDAARSRHDQEATADAVWVLQTLPDRERPGVVVSRPPAGHPLWVAAPPELLRSAVAPLVDNALRHARSTVELSAERRGGRVLVRVLDDGAGVPEAEAAAVFAPGHQGPDGGSAGLGLAVVRRLVESVGGTVQAVPGVGGRFEVDLPAAD